MIPRSLIRADYIIRLEGIELISRCFEQLKFSIQLYIYIFLHVLFENSISQTFSNIKTNFASNTLNGYPRYQTQAKHRCRNSYVYVHSFIQVYQSMTKFVF